ncbi:hypothetical protein CIPAW_11G064400 [Carya illinoinensis]|uniref:Neprosin PEP catalytic domain-containing protein n=1 Tax=Carya illinoinensis TaxID=32201 RepID=A0A8T1P1X8_CARIL|nr:hypothetical protein CIPAW_11G064400 [Carya illinoinensis]
MASRVDVLLVLFVWFVLLNHNIEVDANWGLSRKEELRFKEQLTSLSTSAIRSIHEDGDVYDCIDFYKQPGFHHPFWKNTTFQVWIMFTPTLAMDLVLTYEGCPYGTVPIRRIDKVEVNSDIEEEPGHHVNPLLFKDNKTRLFTHIVVSISKLYSITQCFNQQCPGYIQLSSEIPLGWPVGKISVVGGLLTFAIYCTCYHWKDYMSTGPNSIESVWLLQMDDDMLKVGLWPTKVFGRLNYLGNQADWGGEVYSPLDQPSPPMGTGIHPYGDTRYAAHSRLIGISYENSESKFVNPGGAVLYESDPKSYSVFDSGYRTGYWGRLILYDGPGGIKSD